MAFYVCNFYCFLALLILCFDFVLMLLYSVVWKPPPSITFCLFTTIFALGEVFPICEYTFLSLPPPFLSHTLTLALTYSIVNINFIGHQIFTPISLASFKWWGARILLLDIYIYTLMPFNLNTKHNKYQLLCQADEKWRKGRRERNTTTIRERYVLRAQVEMKCYECQNKNDMWYAIPKWGFNFITECLSSTIFPFVHSLVCSVFFSNSQSIFSIGSFMCVRVCVCSCAG